MTRCIGYIRVSSQRQVSGHSLDAQRKALAEYCEREGWKLVQIFEERGESAKTADRTELKKMIHYCAEHSDDVDAVLIYSLDRLSRNVGDYHALRASFAKINIDLRSVSEKIEDTPQGRFLETVLSAVSQLDNDVRATKSVLGMKEAMASGKWVWQPPTGYRSGGKGEPSLVQGDDAPLVRCMFDMHANGSSKDGLRRWAKSVQFRGGKLGKHAIDSC